MFLNEFCLLLPLDTIYNSHFSYYKNLSELLRDGLYSTTHTLVHAEYGRNSGRVGKYDKLPS